MNKTDITTDNLDQLIRVFYGRVRKDDLIGPYFNATIQGEEVWEEHYKLLVDFWALNVLGISGFNGNPAKAHHSVDKSFKNSITTDHFDRWVSIWTVTIDELFEGDMAEKAKEKARNMAKGMYKKVLERRSNGFILPGNVSGLSFGK